MNPSGARKAWRSTLPAARQFQRKVNRTSAPARFPFVRDLEGFDFAAQPSLDKKQIRKIATGRFIANAEAVMLLGPPDPAS